MHESGRRVGKTVHAIENAAMAGYEAARVLDSEMRFTAESVMSPRNPATPRIAPASADQHQYIGVR